MQTDWCYPSQRDGRTSAGKHTTHLKTTCDKPFKKHITETHDPKFFFFYTTPKRRTPAPPRQATTPAIVVTLRASMPSSIIRVSGGCGSQCSAEFGTTKMKSKAGIQVMFFSFLIYALTELFAELRLLDDDPVPPPRPARRCHLQTPLTAQSQWV